MSQIFPSTQHFNLSLIFEYLLRRSQDEPNILHSVVSRYEQNARGGAFPVRLVVQILGWFLRPRMRKVRYFVFGTKYTDLILSLPDSEVCVIGGLRQLLFCLRKRRAFLPSLFIWDQLIYGLRNEMEIECASLRNSIDRAALRIYRHAAADGVLVIENDSLPLQRAMIMAARQAGIRRCVCVQHGLFQSKSPAHIMDGWFADLFFVFSAQQKEMLIGKGMEPFKIGVMGFHSSVYRPTRLTSQPGRRSVCFLGQHWFVSSNERGKHYVEFLMQLQAQFDLAGIKMHYKPHPGEVGSEYLTEVRNMVDIPLAEAFETFDVFISLTSTALLEAAWSGRVAIQIVDPVFDADRMEDFDHIVSINRYDSRFLETLMEMIQYAPAEKHANIGSPGERFIACLTTINRDSSHDF